MVSHAAVPEWGAVRAPFWSEHEELPAGPASGEATVASVAASRALAWPASWAFPASAFAVPVAHAGVPGNGASP